MYGTLCSIETPDALNPGGALSKDQPRTGYRPLNPDVVQLLGNTLEPNNFCHRVSKGLLEWVLDSNIKSAFGSSLFLTPSSSEWTKDLSKCPLHLYDRRANLDNACSSSCALKQSALNLYHPRVLSNEGGALNRNLSVLPQKCTFLMRN